MDGNENVSELNIQKYTEKKMTDISHLFSYFPSDRYLHAASAATAPSAAAVVS